MATTTADLAPTGAAPSSPTQLRDTPALSAAGATAERRPHLMVVGTFFAIAAGTMLIGGLLAGWLAARDTALSAGSPWLREGVDIPNMAVAVTYLTLLMSSFTAQWAVYAAKTDDRKNLYVAIGITLVLGLAFVNGLSFVYDRLGLEAGMTDIATHTYAVTVTHLLLVIAAHVLFVVMGFRAMTGQVTARRRELVASAAAFWHFTVLAGAAVYLVVFFFEGAPT